jgi:hypothetical protein
MEYSLCPIKTNLVSDVTHPSTTNLDIYISKFIVLEYVTSGPRFVFMGRREYIDTSYLCMCDRLPYTIRKLTRDCGNNPHKQVLYRAGSGVSEFY